MPALYILLTVFIFREKQFRNCSLKREIGLRREEGVDTSSRIETIESQNVIYFVTSCQVKVVLFVLCGFREIVTCSRSGVFRGLVLMSEQELTIIYER